GAGSRIFAVSHPQTKQLYALKYVDRRTEKDDRFIEHVEAEYQVGRQVRHDGLRRCLDLKINRTLLRKVTDAALIMELFDGQPLELNRPRTLDAILDCFIQTARALEGLHGMGF